MSIILKFFNSFKHLRMNSKKEVSGNQLNYILVSSMYAEQQSAYLNSYETGLSKSILKNILQDYWQIFNRDEAVEALVDLLDGHEDIYIDVAYRAYAMGDDYADFLKANLPSDPDQFKYYLEIYRKLRNIVPGLIEDGVIKDISDVTKIKVSGWNYGRAAFLTRCCFDMGYITQAEMLEYLENAYVGLKKYCTTWKEYTTSYIFGRAIWGGPYNGEIVNIADDLLHKEKSPLKDRKNI